MHWIKRIINIVAKNLLALIFGASVGFLVMLFFVLPMALEKAAKEAGLAIIALVPVLFIIYFVIFVVGGGVLGIVIFNIVSFALRKVRGR